MSIFSIVEVILKLVTILNYLLSYRLNMTKLSHLQYITFILISIFFPMKDDFIFMLTRQR
jgi:hypothetical protein